MKKYVATVNLVRRTSGDLYKPHQSNETQILVKDQVYTQQEVDAMQSWYLTSGYLSEV